MDSDPPNHRSAVHASLQVADNFSRNEQQQDSANSDSGEGPTPDTAGDGNTTLHKKHKAHHTAVKAATPKLKDVMAGIIG
jgi:hypothetical protein